MYRYLKVCLFSLSFVAMLGLVMGPATAQRAGKKPNILFHHGR